MAGKKDLERLRRRKRRKQNIIRATVHFFVWAGVAVLYYVGFSLFFDTPVEYELKHSTDRLRREYAALTQRYDSLTTVMHNLSERDRNVFRILFESDPYDFDSEYERRQAVTYENIFNRSSRRLKLELRERVADMEKRLDELNASYLDLQALIDSAGSGCNNIPAIQPVINKQHNRQKDRQKNRAGKQHRHPSFLSTHNSGIVYHSRAEFSSGRKKDRTEGNSVRSLKLLQVICPSACGGTGSLCRPAWS